MADDAPRFEIVSTPSPPLSVEHMRHLDLIEVLPAGAQGRLRALRQRVADAPALIPSSESVREANTAKVEAANRFQRMTSHPADFGLGISESDPRALRAADAADKATQNAERLQGLYQTRLAAWRDTSRILVSVEGWLKDGRPGGTILKDHEAAPLPTLKAGQRLADALKAARRHTDECRRAVARVEGAPWPSSHAKQRLREEVRTLCARGRPDVSALLQRNGALGWPQANLRGDVLNASLGEGVRAAVAFTQTTDMLALVAWTFEGALLERLDAEVDAIADDDSALGETERAQRLSDAQIRLLAAERAEVAITWAMLDEGQPVEFRDLAAAAVLGLELIIAPRPVQSPGTSPEHGISFIGPAR
jgi:hypothetical protein